MLLILCSNTDQLNEVRKVTLAKVYCENADDISTIQERVMEMPFREAFPSFEYVSVYLKHTARLNYTVE